MKPDPEKQLELDTRDVIARFPEMAEPLQQAALWLLAVRRKEIRLKFKRLRLDNGEPIDDSDHAA